jgi:hypothetical protein
VHLRPGGASAGGELGRVESGGLAWAARCDGLLRCGARRGGEIEALTGDRRLLVAEEGGACWRAVAWRKWWWPGHSDVEARLGAGGRQAAACWR